MRVFISGPVTGTYDYFKRFADAVDDITDFFGPNCEVVNPIDCTEQLPDTLTHAEYMTVTMALLKICNMIYMLRDWEQSEGAREEHEYAARHGYRIMYEG